MCFLLVFLLYYGKVNGQKLHNINFHFISTSGFRDMSIFILNFAVKDGRHAPERFVQKVVCNGTAFLQTALFCDN